MKKRKKIIKTLSLFLVALLLYPLIFNNTVFADTTTSDTIVNIPDDNLKSALLTKLNKSANDSITQKDMASFTDLDLSNCNIESIDGLQYCTNVTSLLLNNNIISNLNPLKNIVTLQELNIENNKISNFEPLYNLIKSSTKICASNQSIELNSQDFQNSITIHNVLYDSTIDIPITFVSNGGHYSPYLDDHYMLHRLYYSIDWHNLDPDTLSTLNIPGNKKGVYYNFYYSNDTNYTVSGTVNLPLKVNISKNIEDSNLKSALLNKLNKKNNDEISQEEALSIKDIDLSNLNISSLEGIESFKNLETLNLSNNNITNIAPLKKLTKLNSVNITNQSITLYNGISKNSDFSLVNPIKDINFNTVTNINNISNNGTYSKDSNTINWRGLNSNIKLKYDFSYKDNVYNFSGTVIKPISYLPPTSVDIASSSLKKAVLKRLGKTDDDVITGKDAYSLTTLDLSNSEIDSIEGIECFRNLKDLNLANNKIYNLSPLKELKNLQKVNVINQKVTLDKGECSTGNVLLTNPLIDINGSPVLSIDNINNNGTFDEQTNTLTWYEINQDINLTYDFSQSLTTNNITFQFSGTVTKPITYNEPSSVDIPDKNLKLAILKQLGKEPEDKITKKDMKSITDLYVSNKAIESIDGLEYCSNLECLDLSHNNIQDLSPLSGLKNITNLTMPYNEIMDLTPLSHLTNIQVLYLQNNIISDISPLAYLTNLAYTDLSNNEITDISSLSKLKNINLLYLNHNKISDISSLSNLESLKYLDLSFNEINQLKSLNNSLQFLNLNNNSITNISTLENLTNIDSLFLDNNVITDISAISNLTNLTSLFLFNNFITDCSAVSKCTQLKYLSLAKNKLSDISPLASLNKITSLYLNSNNITDISSLSNLLNLENLALGMNKITDISPLITDTNMKVLYINNNNISDISTVSKFKNLSELAISYNPVQNISPLSKLTKLNSLIAYNCNISDIYALKNLTNLETLLLEKNSISDISPLINLTKIKDISLNEQHIVLPQKNCSESFSSINPLISIDGTPVTSITNISNRGEYYKNTNTITWTNLNYNTLVTFGFSQPVTIGNTSSSFSGDVCRTLKYVK